MSTDTMPSRKYHRIIERPQSLNILGQVLLPSYYSLSGGLSLLPHPCNQL